MSESTERKEKFTPGPWRVMGPYGGITRPWIDADLNGSKRSIIICGTEEDERGIVGISNAALIAAAPDMYAALKDLLALPQNQCGNCDDESECKFCRASAALSKARGES